MALLEVENLSVSYSNSNRPAVEKLSFQLNEGEILCIVGESGSGKSTVLRAIGGLLPTNSRVSGRIVFKGRDLIPLSREERRRLMGREIGFIFQEPSVYLDPLFKVGDQIRETCEIHFPQRDCKNRALSSLRYCGVPDPLRVYNSYPHQLSGGLKQRVNIADATVNNPSLLLADEPTTALDVSTQKRILQLFLKLKADGKAILLVTHDFGVVWEVADRVLVMKNGRKVEEGDVFQIYENPRHPYTKRLVEIFKELSSIG